MGTPCNVLFVGPSHYYVSLSALKLEQRARYPNIDLHFDVESTAAAAWSRANSSSYDIYVIHGSDNETVHGNDLLSVALKNTYPSNRVVGLSLQSPQLRREEKFDDVIDTNNMIDQFIDLLKKYHFILP